MPKHERTTARTYDDLMTESDAYCKLCDDMGEICDGWQMGFINEHEARMRVNTAFDAWLNDQMAHTPT